MKQSTKLFESLKRCPFPFGAEIIQLQKELQKLRDEQSRINFTRKKMFEAQSRTAKAFIYLHSRLFSKLKS